MVRAEHAGAIYAARWEIELLFLGLKSHYRLDHIPSGNRWISESLIYASAHASTSAAYPSTAELAS